MPIAADSVKKLLSSKPFAISVIILISFAVYFLTLWNGFVYDDKPQILGNPWITDIKYIAEIFISDVWGFDEQSSNYYRPMMHIVYMLNYHVFGLSPWGFHLVNVLLHAGISVLVFVIASALFNKFAVSMTFGKKWGAHELLPPFIAALLFATHPIHTEAVAWVAGIPELLFTLFYLLSFYFYIKKDEARGRWLILSLVFFFLSALSKETALTLPIMLFVYDYSCKKNMRAELIIRRYAPYAIVGGIYFMLRTYAIGGFAPFKRHAELSGYEYFINVFPLFTQYIEKLVLPINLNAFYVFHPISSLVEWKGLIALILTLTFMCFIYLSHRYNRLVFLSLLWIALPLLPVLYIPALGENTFADRYLYLPSVGFVLLISLALERIYCDKRLGQTAFPIIISILITVTGLYSIGTVKRNYVWRDNYTLWLDTVKKSPDGALPHNSMGVVYLKQGHLDEALQEFQTALRLEPDYLNARINLGVSFANKGWLDDAIKEFKLAIKLKPDSPEAYHNLGVAYYDKGWIDMAIEHYRIALRLKPIHRKAHYNLAKAYYDKGLVDMAMEHYRIAQYLKQMD